MRVHLCTRDFGGWRTLVQPGAFFEFFDEKHNLCLKVDAAMFLDLFATHIRMARWVAAIAAQPMNALAFERMELDSPGEPPILSPPQELKPLARAEPRATVTPERRQALREKRRARR